MYPTIYNCITAIIVFAESLSGIPQTANPYIAFIENDGMIADK